MYYNTTLAILCGGKAKRMNGVEKGLIEIDGQTIIEKQIKTLSPFFQETMLITNSCDTYKHLDVPIFSDNYQKIGPIGGLESALSNAKSEFITLIACDMPFISIQIMELVASARVSAEVVVPIINNLPQPLLVRIARRCHDIVQESIKDNDFKLVHVYEKLDAEYILEERLREKDPELKSFVNLNSPEDIKLYS